MSACTEWAGSRNDRGYGRVGGRMAHRVAWEEARGPIPEGLTVDHLCFNPSCVNVDHLRLLSLLENARNQRSALKTHCARGHEYTPDNTYIRPARYRGGRRDCRSCIRERVSRYKKRSSA